jgi:hypothetical protein
VRRPGADLLVLSVNVRPRAWTSGGSSLKLVTHPRSGTLTACLQSMAKVSSTVSGLAWNASQGPSVYGNVQACWCRLWVSPRTPAVTVPAAETGHRLSRLLSYAKGGIDGGGSSAAGSAAAPARPPAARSSTRCAWAGHWPGHRRTYPPAATARPAQTRPQQHQQLTAFPGRKSGPYPGSSSRLRFCCRHTRMIGRRLRPVEPAASPRSAAGQTPNGCCRTRHSWVRLGSGVVERPTLRLGWR